MLNSNDPCKANSASVTTKFASCAVLLLLFSASISYAAYSSTGNVTPTTDPATWTTSTTVNIGYDSNATFTANNGSTLASGVTTIGYLEDSTGEATVDDSDTYWLIQSTFCIGRSGDGTFNVTDGGDVDVDFYAYVGFLANSTGALNVNGDGSTFNVTNDLSIGDSGTGSMVVEDGGVVSSNIAYIGRYAPSSGVVTVSGNGTIFEVSSNLSVGYDGPGSLEIFSDGLVKVGSLTIDYDRDNDSKIRMGTGGQLAIIGDIDASITEFLASVVGLQTIQYWNESANSWENIAEAVAGDDYTLEYKTSGDLSGYTVLTVLTDFPGTEGGGCGSAGLPLIASVMLAGLMLVKFEK